MFWISALLHVFFKISKFNCFIKKGVCPLKHLLKLFMRVCLYIEDSISSFDGFFEETWLYLWSNVIILLDFLSLESRVLLIDFWVTCKFVSSCKWLMDCRDWERFFFQIEVKSKLSFLNSLFLSKIEESLFFRFL